MSLALADRVRQTSTSTGTGTITLDGSVEGYQSFEVIGNNNTTYYTISGGAQWEVGIGTYYGGTLARTTVISSSTGSKLDLATGTKDVFVTLPSSVAITSGTDVTFTKVTTPTVQATNSGGLSLKNSAGTTQISMGGGGGDNISLNVSTNLNGTNAQIDISPTGTGHVHMKPTGVNSIEIAPTFAGDIDNMIIGAVTPKNGSFVDLSVTGITSFDGSQGTAGQVLTSAGTGATPTWATPAVYATVTDDTTTNAVRYPLFAAVTSGNLTTEYVSSTKLQYNPSTGALTASQLIIAP